MTRVHHRNYNRRRLEYDRIRHAIEGQAAMRENAALYLRRPDGLTATEWTNYVRGATYYPVVENTLESMIGLCVRKDPRIELPARLEPMMKAASYDGDALPVLFERILRETLTTGRMAAVLDFPVEGNTANSTPYISTFQAEDIYDWKAGIVDGVKRLTYIRLHEFNEDLEDTGTEQHIVLSLEPALTVRRYHVQTKATTAGSTTEEVQVGEDILPLINGSPVFFLPVVIFGPNDLNPDSEKPPLLDLTDVSIQHFENSANYEHALWMSAMPTPVITGAINADQQPRSIGPSAIWNLPEGATATYLAAPSDAHESLRKAILDKEARMAALGAQMILSGQRRNEAAETASMRYSRDTSVLQSTITQVEMGMLTLLTWASQWVQASGNVIFEANKDLVSTTIDAPTLTALNKALISGSISRQTFIEVLQRGEIVRRSTEEELDLIEAEGGDLDNILPIDRSA